MQGPKQAARRPEAGPPGRHFGRREGVEGGSACKECLETRWRHMNISHAHSGSQDTAPSQQRPKVVANRQVFALVFRTHMTAAHSAAFIRATFGTLKRSHPTVLVLPFLLLARRRSADDNREEQDDDDIRREHHIDGEDRRELR